VHTAPDVASRSQDALASYAGTYTRENGACFEVRVVDSTLVVEANAWLEHALLFSLYGTDVEVLLARSVRADELADEWIHGWCNLLFEAYGRRWSIEELQKRSESQRRSNEMRLGSLRGYRVLGTSVARTGTMTLVRFDYEQGTEYGRYLWREDGGLREIQTPDPPTEPRDVWRDPGAAPPRARGPHFCRMNLRWSWRAPICMWTKYTPDGTRLPASSRAFHCSTRRPGDCEPSSNTRTRLPATS
jgi:hypothetical protein